MPKIQQLQERYPEHEIVVIPIIEEDEALKSTDYDLLILNSRAPHLYRNRTDVKFLRYEYMGPVCSQELYSQHANLEALLTLPRLHSTLDHHDWKTWLASIGHSDGKRARNTTFFTLDLALSACLSGQGVTVTDLLLILPELEHGYLVSPNNIQIEPSEWQYFCHCRSSSQIVEEIQEWIEQEALKEIEVLKDLSNKFGWVLKSD